MSKKSSFDKGFDEEMAGTAEIESKEKTAADPKPTPDEQFKTNVVTSAKENELDGYLNAIRMTVLSKLTWQEIVNELRRRGAKVPEYADIPTS